MKKERENLELLLICMVIGIIAACITGYFLYENKKEYWEVQARDIFYEALTEEVQKRSGMEVFFVQNEIFICQLIRRKNQ